jgi:hypothetical protein
MSVVYHGSFLVIEHPIVIKSTRGLDFGEGFYVTNLMEQAIDMAARRKVFRGRGVVNVYSFDTEAASAYRYHKFSGAKEDWLDFVVKYRSNPGVCEDYDIIEGEVADDGVFDSIQAYLNGLMRKSDLLKKLKYKKENHQICLNDINVIKSVLRLKTWFEI